MTLSEAGTNLGTLYLKCLSFWYDDLPVIVYNHPVEFDIAIVAVVAGSCLYLTNRARRMRIKAHRLLAGVLMKRRDRAKYHNMKIEDAIIDACMDMVHHGDMTPDEEQKKYKQYAKAYDLTGLLPGKDQASVKRGINLRLLRGWWTKKKEMLIGPPPGGAVDPNYQPEFAVARIGLESSKYATEK